MSAARAWLAVASAEHVARGRAGGYMQVCHGKAAPLRRLQPGDRVVYYSPTRTFGGKDRLQAFTAWGHVRAGAAYAHDMGGGFVPFRRDVDWQPGTAFAPIQPLLGELVLTAGKPAWGAVLRFGLVALSESDMDRIALAMGRATPARPSAQLALLA